MCKEIPWNYKISGFVSPEVLLPKLKTYPDIHASEECLILYKNMLQGVMYISATSGYLCQVKMRNEDSVWYSEVGEVEVIGWMPMPKCNFELNEFHNDTEIHKHLQDKDELKLKKFNLAQFTSLNDGLPCIPDNDLNLTPLIVVKELKTTSGYDYFFSLGSWDKKRGLKGWYSEHPIGNVVGWMKMPNTTNLNIPNDIWSI